MENFSIEGSSVLSASVIHDYLQINMSCGAVFNVFNKYKTIGGELDDITGRTIIHLKTLDNCIDIEFSGGLRLIIGLEDDDYRGPEAAVLDFLDGKRIMVWN